MDCRAPGLPVHHQHLEFTQTHVHWVSDAIQPSHPQLLSSPFCLQSFPTSGSFLMSRLFSSSLPKYWSFSFIISPSNEYSGLISFKIDWFECLAVHGALKSLVQHHGLKASVLWGSAFLGPTLTSVRDYWKNHSFEYKKLCGQSNISAF